MYDVQQPYACDVLINKILQARLSSPRPQYPYAHSSFRLVHITYWGRMNNLYYCMYVVIDGLGFLTKLTYTGPRLCIFN